MKKTSYGFVLGSLLVATFTGYGSGCSNDETQVGSCNIADASKAPGYLPPVRAASQCTDPQLAEFRDACTGPKATETACNAFYAKNTSCRECLFPPESITTYEGAYLGSFPNQPGYLSLLGASSACVTAYHNAFACNIVACQFCGTTKACNDKVLGKGGQCEAKYAAFQSACTSAEDKAALQKTESDLSDLVGFLKAFCGAPRPVNDGGTDGSTDASDSGSSDSGDAGDASLDASTDA
ncbi:hypothetical protein [Pendulispora albinea]|uniref:Secreted protein n=1 Tax=Pendulispora albinea TaxID=2741071 RepID=A0ABZ2M8K3_9BACT